MVKDKERIRRYNMASLKTKKNVINFPQSRTNIKFCYEVIEYNARTGKEEIVSIANNNAELNAVWRFLGQRHIMSTDTIWHRVRSIKSKLD